MNTVGLQVPLEAVKQFCARRGIRSFALFGSVLRDDFRPESDVDVLVEYEETARHDLWDHVNMQEELGQLLGGRRVDLINRSALEQSHNWIRKQAILESAKIIYVSR